MLFGIIDENSIDKFDRKEDFMRKIITKSKSTKKAIAQIRDGIVIRTFSNIREAFFKLIGGVENDK